MLNNYEYRKSLIRSHGISSRVSFIDIYLYTPNFVHIRTTFCGRTDVGTCIRMDTDPSFRLTSGLYLKCVQMTLHSLPVSTVLSSNQSMPVAKKSGALLAKIVRYKAVCWWRIGFNTVWSVLYERSKYNTLQTILKRTNIDDPLSGRQLVGRSLKPPLVGVVTMQRRMWAVVTLWVAGRCCDVKSWKSR